MNPFSEARGVAGDRERLEDGERVVLHQHPVLERAGLGLVGVADEVVRVGSVLRDRLPLHTGGERRAPTPRSFASLSSRITPSDRARPPAERLVPTVRSVVVERRRIDDTGAQQAETVAIPSRLRRDHRLLARSSSSRGRRAGTDRAARSTPGRRPRRCHRRLQERRRRPLAHAETRAPEHLLSFRACRTTSSIRFVGARDLAGDVVAQVQDTSSDVVRPRTSRRTSRRRRPRRAGP